MKKDALKSTLSLVALSLMSTTLTVSSDVQSKHIILYAKLIAELGPERAQEFKNRLEERHKKQPVKPIAPKPVTPQPPVVIPQPEPPKVIPAPQPPVTIQPPMAPAPVVPTWLTDSEKNDFNVLTSGLLLYTAKVFDCVNEFFNKNNNELYRNHVNCFKTQLQFVRNIVQKQPQAQTPAGSTLFNALKKITIALEKSQDLMCQTLDQDYPGMGVMGVVILGSKMKQIETPVNQQRNIINEQIGVVRNELRKAHAGEMLAVISKLNTSINKTFDYKKDKSLTELLDKLKHRVKR